MTSPAIPPGIRQLAEAVANQMRADDASFYSLYSDGCDEGAVQHLSTLIIQARIRAASRIFEGRSTVNDRDAAIAAAGLLLAADRIVADPATLEPFVAAALAPRVEDRSSNASGPAPIKPPDQFG
ncbi:hypothetical protein [Neoroseomonas soli]|uniref:Uncharacterized protein n=1 Tax=Neoroseomonas soli TaxID=1081025 RepID=A0A9X9WVI1_9PROT|nr:hypothetical protein [Neoroseomonas soli]MBR0671160.1 hypothetical protein [Neoroseomonas soli]